MAQKKKKKPQKKPVGATRSSYAKGKKIEPKGSPKKRAQPAARSTAQKDSGKRPAESRSEERPQWNLVRRGSLEIKVMWVLLAVIVAAALLQYPLIQAEALYQYNTAQEDLKEWEEKYPSEKEQEEHKDEKPSVPPRPTSGIILFSIAFSVLQTGIFAFLGLNISRRTDMSTPLLDRLASREAVEKNDLRPLLTHTLPGAVLILAPLMAGAKISADIYNVLLKSTETTGARYPQWKVVLGTFNDALLYEMLFVFFTVSVFVWVFTRYREKVKVEPHWGALGLATLFTLGFIYLNISSGTSGGGVSVSTGTLLLYSLCLAAPVLVLGYLYWKKGLEYSVLAALVAFAAYPLMAGLIIT